MTTSPTPPIDPSTKVEATINGLPGTLTAGRTTQFSVTFTNTASQAVNLGPVVGFGIDGLRARHIRLDVNQDGTWQPLPVEGVEEVPGLVVALLTEEPVKLTPGASLTRNLRVTFTTKAPSGDGAAQLYGFDIDNDYDLVAFAYQDLKLVEGSKQSTRQPTEQPTKKWTPKGTPAQTAETVQRQTLAKTGAGNNLPLFGAIGASLVVAGVGATFLVRRRRGSGQSTQET